MAEMDEDSLQPRWEGGREVLNISFDKFDYTSVNTRVVDCVKYVCRLLITTCWPRALLLLRT